MWACMRVCSDWLTCKRLPCALVMWHSSSLLCWNKLYYHSCIILHILYLPVQSFILINCLQVKNVLQFTNQFHLYNTIYIYIVYNKDNIKLVYVKFAEIGLCTSLRHRINKPADSAECVVWHHAVCDIVRASCPCRPVSRGIITINITTAPRPRLKPSVWRAETHGNGAAIVSAF